MAEVDVPTHLPNRSIRLFLPTVSKRVENKLCTTSEAIPLPHLPFICLFRRGTAKHRSLGGIRLSVVAPLSARRSSSLDFDAAAGIMTKSPPHHFVWTPTDGDQPSPTCEVKNADGINFALPIRSID